MSSKTIVSFKCYRTSSPSSVAIGSPHLIGSSCSTVTVNDSSLMTLKSCKNCNYSFRFELRQTSDFCSKDCETCYFWFKNKPPPADTSNNSALTPEPTMQQYSESVSPLQVDLSLSSIRCRENQRAIMKKSVSLLTLSLIFQEPVSIEQYHFKPKNAVQI